MTVPLDEINDIREMDAVGVPRAEIARRLGLSRNTVAKYADMADMSPAAPEPRSRARRALGPDDAACGLATSIWTIPGGTAPLP